MGEPARWQEGIEEFVLGQVGDPPGRVLEVGCGAGELAQALARAGHFVTAIDPRAPEGPIFRRVRIEEFSDPEGRFPFTRPDAERFAAAAGALGIGSDTTVIIYDTALGQWALPTDRTRWRLLFPVIG